MLHQLGSLLREAVLLPPPGPFLMPTILLVLLGGSLLPSGKTSSLGVTAVLSYLLSQFRHPTRDVIQDAVLPIQGLILFAKWVDFYVLHDAEKEYWRVKDVKNGTSEEKDVERSNDGWAGLLRSRGLPADYGKAEGCVVCEEVLGRILAPGTAEGMTTEGAGDPIPDPNEIRIHQERQSDFEILEILIYFLIQPLAITFEDFIIYLGRKAGVKESWETRALGKVWTFAWFSYCLRFQFNYNIVALSKPLMPSICKAVAGLARGWVKAGTAL